MQVSVTKAKVQLTDLLRRAEAGDEIVLARCGAAGADAADQRTPGATERRALMEELRRAGSAKAKPGVETARSHDDLYGKDGLPR